MGKTFTLDPITKRRLENFGEEDKFHIKDHHEPIISEEDFDKAQAIRLRRAKNRNTVGSKNGKRDKFSREYTFSCLLECGFCGSNLSRRSWHSNSQYKKTIWQCVRGTKKGKKFCPNSKGIEEIAIEKAFLESYRQLTSNNKDIVSSFLDLVEASLNDKSLEKSIKKLEREITHLLNKQNSLVDLRLEEKIDGDLYEEKYLSLQKEYSEKNREKDALEYSLENNNKIKSRMKTFKTMLERKEILKEFDRYVFESIVEKVIVGEIDEDGKVDPYKLTFVSWDSEFQVFAVNSDVEESATRSEDISMDYDFFHSHLLPLSCGNDYTVKIVPKDINVWLSRLFLGDADGFSILYYQDVDSLVYWANEAAYRWRLRGIAIWSLGQEDMRLWEALPKQI